jgi:hypothetical protein
MSWRTMPKGTELWILEERNQLEATYALIITGYWHKLIFIITFDKICTVKEKMIWI